MHNLKLTACDFWGLNDKNFRFYTENAELAIHDDTHLEHPNSVQGVMTVDKYFET